MKLPEEHEDDPATTIACFGSHLTAASTQFSLREASRAARRRLEDIVGLSHDDCLATIATSEDLEDRLEDPDEAMLWNVWSPASTIMTAAGKPADDRPCKFCKEDDRQEDMILCGRCEACYHRDCASKSGGTRIHDGPWFCPTCKGALTLEGYQDIT